MIPFSGWALWVDIISFLIFPLSHYRGVCVSLHHCTISLQRKANFVYSDQMLYFIIVDKCESLFGPWGRKRACHALTPYAEARLIAHRTFFVCYSQLTTSSFHVNWIVLNTSISQQYQSWLPHSLPLPSTPLVYPSFTTVIPRHTQLTHCPRLGQHWLPSPRRYTKSPLCPLLPARTSDICV